MVESQARTILDDVVPAGTCQPADGIERGIERGRVARSQGELFDGITGSVVLAPKHSHRTCRLDHRTQSIEPDH